MRRKVKRTLKVRTTETWTITWRSDESIKQPPSRVGRRPRKTLPTGETVEGEGNHDMTTTRSQPIENLDSDFTPHSQTGDSS